MACRDRNQIRPASRSHGRHALGIRNVLALTGDPVKAGDHPKAKSVFDLESVRLLQVIQKINGGKDWNDKPLTDGFTIYLSVLPSIRNAPVGLVCKVDLRKK